MTYYDIKIMMILNCPYFVTFRETLNCTGQNDFNKTLNLELSI